MNMKAAIEISPYFDMYGVKCLNGQKNIVFVNTLQKILIINKTTLQTFAYFTTTQFQTKEYNTIVSLENGGQIQGEEILYYSLKV